MEGVPPPDHVDLKVCLEGCFEHSEHPDSALTKGPEVNPLPSDIVIVNLNCISGNVISTITLVCNCVIIMQCIAGCLCQ